MSLIHQFTDEFIANNIRLFVWIQNQFIQCLKELPAASADRLTHRGISWIKFAVNFSKTSDIWSEQDLI